MTEDEMLRQLRHYTKLWKQGGFISGALKAKLDNPFLLQGLGDCGSFCKDNGPKAQAHKNARREISKVRID
jgi:hypothetical protein